MATIADDVTLSAAQLLPVDSTTSKKKKKKSKKKSGAATTATDSIPQQERNAMDDTSFYGAPKSLFTFSQALKELDDAQEAGEDLKEALTRFWRHAYRLGEDDGHFEAAREMEHAGYQQGYDAAIARLTADGHRLEGEYSAGRRTRAEAEILASMQEGAEVVDEAFRRGKDAGLSEGKKAGYHDGLAEGRLESEGTALELFFEGCSAGRKDGTAKERASWIDAGHADSGVCRAGQKDLVDVAVTVGSPTRRFADAAVVTELHDDSNPTDLLFTKSEPFSWADDVSSVPIHSVEPLVSSMPPPRDISCLSSGAQKPFASLQHCSKRNSIQQRRSTGHSRCRYQVPVHQHFTRQSSRLSAPLRRVNTFTTQVSSLDWTGDPRLFRLRDALEDLGWFRR